MRLTMNSSSLYEIRSLPADLAAEMLDAGNDLHVRVTGKSMRPFLKNDDMVTVRKASAAALKTGDILLYRGNNNTLTMHRLLKIQHDGVAPGGMILHTKGDALDRMDPPVAAGQCLGRVVYVERHGRQGGVLSDTLSFRSAITKSLLVCYFRFRVAVARCLAALRRLLVG